MTLEYTFSSNKYKQKEKNGDYLGVFTLEEENITLFLLSDGVGGCVGDWKASETCINLFYKFFERNSIENDIIKRISISLEEVNNNILLEEGFFKGMKATFVVVIFENDKSQIHYASIGDSRIYKISQNEVSQISKDQVKVVVRRKKDDTPYTQNGSIINAQGVTNVMGAEPLDFEVNSLKIENDTSFLMASDGFYSKISQLDKTLQNISNEVAIDSAFKQLAKQVTIHQDDDASAIFIRISKNSDETQITLDDIFENNTKFSKLEINNAICNELIKAVKIKDDNIALQLIKQISKHNIQFSFEFYDSAIKLLMNSNVTDDTVYQQLVSLLKKSRQ